MNRVGIDTGGTFTDAVAAGSDGVLRVHKVPTTVDQPARAVLQALSHLAPKEVAVELIHGTTHATNALLTGRLGRVVLVTTAGMRDVLAIGRQDRDRLYALEPRPRRPFLPRRRVVEVEERLDAQGRVVTALTRAEVERVVTQVGRLRPEAVAVGLLHSYRDPRHEQRLARALRRLGVPVVLSSSLAPEIREYERWTTTWADAALIPVVGPALAELDREVGARWPAPSRVRVLRSDGGTALASEAAAEPVHLALSGPAGGLAAARSLADARGDGAVLTLDMGGTSTDVALLPPGELPLAPMELGGLPLLARGLPVHSVGTGGGSLVGWDPGGALTVGPQSAGAAPGPICYGRGGKVVTVTDAHLVAGRLDPSAFLGGEFPLDVSAAGEAVAALATAHDATAEDLAAAVLEIACADMERAVRRVSLAEGHDPRDFHLYAFGGAGGLHAAWIAARLGMRGVVIPPHAGAFSAVGMLSAPPRRTLVQTVLEPLPGIRKRQSWFAPLVAAARESLLAEGIKRSHLGLRRLLELRSSGQSAVFTLAEGPQLEERFHQEHQRRFGYQRREVAIEVAAVRVIAEGRATPLWQPTRRRRRAAPVVSHHLARMPESEPTAAVRTAVHRRESLQPGDFLNGPALVTEYSGTTVVPPGWRAEIDAFSALVLHPEDHS